MNPETMTLATAPADVEAVIAETLRHIAVAVPDFAAVERAAWADGTRRRPVTPAALPVITHLPACLAAAPESTRAPVAALAHSAHGLAWRRTYAAGSLKEAFLENYGWSELVGLTGPVPATTVAVGFLVLGPHLEYPPHHHEARERYLPLAGRAAWWQPESGWRTVVPGETVLHERWVPHAMRTDGEPLLALYLWESENLAQSARLIAA